LTGPIVPSGPTGPPWRVPLPHSPEAVPIARALVRTAFADLDEPSADAETAELLTAELVANAVRHTSGDEPIELVVEVLESGCQVEVHDRDPAPPADLRTAHSDPYQLAENGRRLLLIRTLSSTAGYHATEHGKAVWFTLGPHERQDRPEEYPDRPDDGPDDRPEEPVRDPG